MRTPRMMLTDRKSTRAVIRDHANRTKGEWHQWLARVHRPKAKPEEPDVQPVPWMTYVNNVYTVVHRQGEHSLLATRHSGRWQMWELQRIADELLWHGATFAVDGRMTDGSTAIMLIGPKERAQLDEAFDKKDQTEDQDTSKEETDEEAV